MFLPKNVISSAALINNITVNYHDDTTVRLSWDSEQNYNIINKFEINCFYQDQDTKHIAQSTVSEGNFSVELSGLIPSKSYDCCVSAVLERYMYISSDCTVVTTSEAVVSYTKSADVST